MRAKLQLSIIISIVFIILNGSVIAFELPVNSGNAMVEVEDSYSRDLLMPKALFTTLKAGAEVPDSPVVFSDNELSLNFPAYSSLADIYVAVGNSSGLFFVDSSNDLTSDYVPYAMGSKEPFKTSFSIADDLSAFKLFGDGTVYWVIGPGNGGNFESTISDGAYELGQFNVTYPGKSLPTERTILTPKTEQEIADSPVLFKDNNLLVNFPAYGAPADIYLAVQNSSGLFFVNSNGELTPESVPYAMGATGNLEDSIAMSDFITGGMSGSELSGNGSVYWLVAPGNGGDFPGAVAEGAYELGFYKIKFEKIMPTRNPADAIIPRSPAYDQTHDWLALPENPDKYPVDVFWVYPTILSNDTRWLMDIDDSKLRQAALETVITQASVFEGLGNIYVPAYRQTNIGMLYSKDDTTLIHQTANQDVEDALDYYLENYNNGRPFILAGHSQGSEHLVEIATRIWGISPKHTLLVAAYTLGWSITPGDLEKNPKIKVCKDADQTGCFIAYNSIAPGKQSKITNLTRGKSYVVNPLTWKIDSVFAPASLNQKSVFFNDDGTVTSYENFATAQVVNSALQVLAAKPSILGPISGPLAGIYHVFDYSLFYKNIQDNAALRIRNFTDKLNM